MDLYLHVGLPKTGTSTFLRHVFPNLDGVAKITTKFSDPKLISAVRSLRSRNASQFVVEAKNRANQTFDQVQSNEKVIYSDEVILKPAALGIDNTIEHLGTVFAPARVILILRNLPDLFLSIYRQDIVSRLNSILFAANNRTLSEVPINIPSVDAFFASPKVGPLHMFSMFNFDLIIESLEKSFGTDNLLVLRQEYIKQDFRSVVLTVCDFMDVEPLDKSALDSTPFENVSGYGQINSIVKEIQSHNLEFDFIEQIRDLYLNCKLTAPQKSVLTEMENDKCPKAFALCDAMVGR